jgi:hypothetical protein
MPRESLSGFIRGTGTNAWRPKKPCRWCAQNRTKSSNAWIVGYASLHYYSSLHIIVAPSDVLIDGHGVQGLGQSFGLVVLDRPDERACQVFWGSASGASFFPACSLVNVRQITKQQEYLIPKQKGRRHLSNAYLPWKDVKASVQIRIRTLRSYKCLGLGCS